MQEAVLRPLGTQHDCLDVLARVRELSLGHDLVRERQVHQEQHEEEQEETTHVRMVGERRNP